MIAQILKIDLNATKEGNGGKSYKGIAVTYQPPEYKGNVKDPVTRFLFGNSDVAKQCKGEGFKEGDWAELSFDESRWKNVEKIVKTTAPNSSGGSSNNVTRNISRPQGRDDDTSIRIARAVAIKEAVNLVGIMTANGGFSAANIKKREFLVETILATAKELEPYLILQEQSDEEVMRDLHDEEDLEQDGYED